MKSTAILCLVQLLACQSVKAAPDTSNPDDAVHTGQSLPDAVADSQSLPDFIADAPIDGGAELDLFFAAELSVSAQDTGSELPILDQQQLGPEVNLSVEDGDADLQGDATCVLDVNGPGPRCCAGESKYCGGNWVPPPIQVVCPANGQVVLELKAHCGTGEWACLSQTAIDGVELSGSAAFSIALSQAQPGVAPFWLSPGAYPYNAEFYVGPDDKPAEFQVRFAPTASGEHDAEITFGGEVDYPPCVGTACIHKHEPFSVKIHGIATAPVADAGATDVPDGAGAPADTTATKD